MRMPHGEPGRADSQRGSILVAASVFLIVGLILLGSIQIGYMYYMKREMQKAADLAALTGVQSIGEGDAAGCQAAQDAAHAAAQDNSVGLTDDNVALDCIFWQLGRASCRERVCQYV